MILFLVSGIPLGIFGPAWISDRAGLVVFSPNSTLFLIVIGAIGWAAIIVAALKSKIGRQFAAAMGRSQT